VFTSTSVPSGVQTLTNANRLLSTRLNCRSPDRAARSATRKSVTSVHTPTHSRTPPSDSVTGTARTLICRYSPSERRTRCSALYVARVATA
jgi:hypothetical protein